MPAMTIVVPQWIGDYVPIAASPVGKTANGTAGYAENSAVPEHHSSRKGMGEAVGEGLEEKG